MPSIIDFSKSHDTVSVKEGGRSPVSFTILINNYNYGRFLGRAIESALGQTWPHVQVLVVDDGSTDESLEIARTYRASNYTVLSKANGGQNSAISFGIPSIQGEYVIVLDSDDWLYPAACHQIADAIGSGVPNAVMYHLDQYDTAGRKIGWFPSMPFVQTNQRDHLAAHGTIPCSPTSGNAYRTEFFKHAFLFVDPSSFSSDGYLASAAAWTEQVTFIRTALGGYLIHGANESTVAGFDTRRVYRNTCHALAHHRHLAQFLASNHEFVDWRDLIDGYTWRSILMLKLTDKMFPEFSWADCRRRGVPKFLVARHFGLWRQFKNTVFLLLGSWLGHVRDLVSR